jgi:fibro-slime domain-containing protein
MRRLVLSGVLGLGVGVVSVFAGCGSDPPSNTFPDDAGMDTGSPSTEGGLMLARNEGGTTDGSAKPVAPCGNGSKEANEECDDGNTKTGDGCSAACKLEPGWQCQKPGAACIAAACGDALVAGNEDCDDGNTMASDGCSPTCQLEPGFKCDMPGKPCTATVCGDNKKEGTEQCDDGNLRPYDGCSPTCTVEPVCNNGACTAVCGDGLKFPGEACDDGNTRSGDGCSATCALEPGFMCMVVTAALPATLDLPIILRDFTPQTSTDFENYNTGVDTGWVSTTLGADKEPTAASLGSPQAITSAASFLQWYHDTANVNMVVFQTLSLAKQPDDSYLFDSSAFFPLDGLGFGNYANSGHNFHFTSEVRHQFTFQGGEVLNFRGDDDVFVFINNKLALDLGGVHGATAGSVTLDPATATALGLTAGGMYEFAVFQAERHTTQSNYKLTLNGFVHAVSECKSVCGDGIKTPDEACDDGTNTGGYGKCAMGCVLGPRCGDGVLQGANGEQCDDGNLISGDGCSSTCQKDTVK